MRSQVALGWVSDHISSHTSTCLSHTYTDVAQHPYEVMEKGWGEFEAVIDLHFRDPSEKPIELRHFVKLFHGNATSSQPTNKKVKKQDAKHTYLPRAVLPCLSLMSVSISPPYSPSYMNTMMRLFLQILP